MYAKKKNNSEHESVDYNDDIIDAPENKSVTIEIRFGGATHRNIKLGQELIVAVISLTLISGIWGTGTAWWLAWSKISGNDQERQLQQAKIVAAEVTKSISENGALASSEKSLLNEIKDQLDSIASQTANASKLFRQDAALSAVEKSALARENVSAKKAYMKGSPNMYLNVKSQGNRLPMKIESLAYFSDSDRDIIRVDLSTIDGRLIVGHVTAQAEYTVDGKNLIVESNSHVPFRAKNYVIKHIDLTRPATGEAQLVSIRIGIRAGSDHNVVFSDWITTKMSREFSASINKGLSGEKSSSSKKTNSPMNADDLALNNDLKNLNSKKSNSAGNKTRMPAEIKNANNRLQLDVFKKFNNSDQDSIEDVKMESIGAETESSDSPITHAMRILSGLRGKSKSETSEAVMSEDFVE